MSRWVLSLLLLALPTLALADDYLCWHYAGSREGQFRYVAEVDPQRRPSEVCVKIPEADIPEQRHLWTTYPIERLKIVGRRLRLREAAERQ